MHEQKLNQESKLTEEYEHEWQRLQSENKAYVHEKQDLEEEFIRLDEQAAQFKQELTRRQNALGDTSAKLKETDTLISIKMQEIAKL